MARRRYSKLPIIVAFVIALAGIGALVGYFITTWDTDEPITIPGPPVAPVTPVPDTPEAPPPEQEPIPEAVTPPVTGSVAFVLPLLDDSDSLVRDGVLDLTRHEAINAWLGVDHLIRKTVALVDNLARGEVAKEPVLVLQPAGKFLVIEVDDETSDEEIWELDTASYARYNLFVEIVESIDAQKAAELYTLISPLLQEAYNDLGYGDQPFEDTLFQAIGRLLETPTLSGPIRLLRPVVLYEYEDPRLEALNQVQKQLLRMGPDNTKRLQAKLTGLALALRGRKP